jgi:hypothetical protein
MRTLVALAGVAALLGACSSRPSIRASDYDQSCTAPDDCTIVQELTIDGSTCSQSCVFGAIAKSAGERFAHDVEDATKNTCSRFDSAACDSGERGVACDAGRCVVVTCAAAGCADAGTD